ncbi:hypothetical protein C0Q70_16706 [Pomacea canaliculata]|uniref:Uncharacterized protein n=1 Tax=Pomacea canaliculata TaxID=400727 RepID=A0A2T7NQI7_POMCA|nr:protein C9orf135-like [Pomacea canaliculata]XP_025109093.1 protein C9orf135-like [Pomacea canaliculata]PVD23437.1 hypothetical protein C0Q70_16706 [Pomacea canaliculata]
MDYFATPDYGERKGSLSLRSDHMDYSRGVFTSKWHQAREAEPKDHDLNHEPKRNLHRSTYNRMATVTDGSLPKTTYQEHSRQIELKPLFDEKDNRRSLFNVETVRVTDIDRDTGDPKYGYGSVLPHHHPDHFKFHSETTYNADYIVHFPYESAPVPEKSPEYEVSSPAYRKCHSQFTDTADYRRPGRNTWMDESGIYTNTHFKREVTKVNDPIPKHFAL